MARLALRYTPAGPDGDPLRTAAAARLLESEVAAPAVVLLGSSQIREGLDCAVIESAVRMPCRNLAVSGGTPLDVLTVARELHDRPQSRITVTGLFPKIVNSEIKPVFFDREGVAALLESGAWKTMDASGWNTVALGLLMNVSPTLRFKDALWGAWDHVRHEPRAAWRQTLPPTADRLLEGATSLPHHYFTKRMGVVNGEASPSAFTPMHLDALDRFIALERQRGNAVVVIDFPTRPGYETTVSAQGRASYAALVERLGQRSDITFVPTSALPPLTEADFVDFTHLGPAGRRKVSEALARVLQNVPGPLMAAGSSPILPGTCAEPRS